MKLEVAKRFNDMFSTAGNESIFNEFAMLVDLPDEQFDLVYDSLKERLKNLFESKSFQADVMNSLKMIGAGSIEEEKIAAQEVIDSIKEDDTLSDNKKDMLISIIEGSVLSIVKLLEVPRERVKVQIKKLTPNAKLPEYAHKTDAGADVFCSEAIEIGAGETKLVKTGIAVAIPAGYEIQVRPRSGLSLKTGLRVANAPGTIDSDYRGEICVIMTNISDKIESISQGDKIAQLVISPVPMIEWEEVKELDSTERGEGGFGSTDKK